MSRFLRDVARGYTCIMARPPPRRNDFVGRSVAIYRWRSWAAEALAPTALEVLRGIISGRDVAMRRAGRGSRAWKAGYLQVSDSMTTGVKPRAIVTPFGGTMDKCSRGRTPSLRQPAAPARSSRLAALLR